MSKDGGYMIDRDNCISNNLSTMESKHCRQWFSDDSGLFPSKRQAVESGLINMSSAVAWQNQIKDDGSIVSKTIVTDESGIFGYGGLEEVEVNWVNVPESQWPKYVGPKVGTAMGQGYAWGIDKAFMPQEEGIRSSSNAMSCFGTSYQDIMDALARPVSSYSLLYEQQPSPRAPKTPRKKEVRLPNSLAIVRNNKVNKKPARKEEPSRFLTNVKSLTATGMLDGVLVRYISSSQKSLPGIIEGTGYLCGCQSCNYSKALNAYEFERHSGCKTSHPNNHIRFENGKSIHQAVQELKNTPQTMLVDAIQTVTGSPINQKAFAAWKESFEAATSRL